MQKTKTYYGKDYGLVFSSVDRKKINVFAGVINNYFHLDYGRKPGTVKGNILFIENEDFGNGNIVHHLFVKKPYDKQVKKIRR